MTPDYSIPGASNGGCNNCHGNLATAPDMWSEWKTAGHATALAREIEGSAGAHFTESCLPCHTVGYETAATAANNGFDDVEPTSGWSYPATLEAGNWNALATNAKLGPLSGIQCENCHGPQSGPTGYPHAQTASNTNWATCNANSDCPSQVCDTSLPSGSFAGNCVPDTRARISWSAAVCANCHQEAPHHYHPAQWDSGMHSDLTLAYQDGTVEGRGTTAAHCGRCHTAQGYAQYVGQLQQGETGNLTSDGLPVTKNGGGVQTNAATVLSLTKLGLTQAAVQPQTCVACRDPPQLIVNGKDTYQLRAYDTIPGLPNGMGKIPGPARASSA